MKLSDFTPCSPSSSRFPTNLFLVDLLLSVVLIMGISSFPSSGEKSSGNLATCVSWGFFCPCSPQKSRRVASLYTSSLQCFLQPASPASGRMGPCSWAAVLGKADQTRIHTTGEHWLLLYVVWVWGLAWRALRVIQSHRPWVVLCPDRVGAPAWEGPVTPRTPPAILLWALCAVDGPVVRPKEQSTVPLILGPP